MKKIGFGLAMLLAGCVSDPEVTEGGGLTPVSAMPTGTATYDGRISRMTTYQDATYDLDRYTNYNDTLSADFTMVANFDSGTTTGTASNARLATNYTYEELGVSAPAYFEDTGNFSGEGVGIGNIGTDADGIYFTVDLNGVLTMTSATRNGIAMAVPDVYTFDTITLTNLPVSGYFTGSTASGIYGRETILTGDTEPGDEVSYTDIITGTKR